MSDTFNTSQNFPWFVFNDKTFGFDADTIAYEFLKTGRVRIYNDGSEQVLTAVRDIINYVINTSYAYNDEAVKDPAKRFQIIINGNILEIYLKHSAFDFIRTSSSKWLINGSYDVGTDFVDSSGTKIEAKVYYSDASMRSKMLAANDGNRYIFHDADYVCCYLISEGVYQWLKRVDGIYVEHNDALFTNLTTKFLPEQLPLCRCITNDAGEWELISFYNN